MSGDRFAPTIAFYVNGTLSRRERERLERHFPECPGCRALLDEARLARELGAAGPWDDHTQAQHLERFVLEPSGVPAELADRIRRHLEGCEACRGAVEQIRRTSDANDLFPFPAITAEAPPRHPQKAERGGGWLARTLLHPVPAAAYLALLLVLLPFALRRESAPAGPSGGKPGPELVDLPVLRPALRGAADEVTLAVTGSAVVLLAIELPAEALRTAVPLRLWMAGSDRGPAVQLEVSASRVEQALAGTGLLVVLLPADLLEPGVRAVELRAGEDAGAEPLVAGTVRIVAGR